MLPFLSWTCTLISCVSLGASPLILQLFLLVASSFSPSDLDSTFNSHESGGSLWTTLLPPLVLASSSSSKDLPKSCFDVYTLYRKTRKQSAWPVVSPFLPQSMASMGYNTHTAVGGSCGKTRVAIMPAALWPCHHTRVGVLPHVVELYRSWSRAHLT